MAGTIGVGLLFTVIFIDPHSSLNPLPPAVMPELVLTASPTAIPRQGLPPTWTPTQAPTETPTATPLPTNTPTPLIQDSATPTASLESSGAAMGLEGSPTAEPGMFHSDAECSLRTAGDQLYGLNGLPISTPTAMPGSETQVPDFAVSSPTEQPEVSDLPADEGISDLFTPEIQYWEKEILAWGEEYELDPDLIATVMQIESCGYIRAKSAAGALGLFQVMPKHFQKKEDPYDPETNAHRGLSWLQRTLKSGGSIEMALAGYNAGIARVKISSLEWPNETRRYVNWGTAIYQDAKCGYETSAALDNWLSKGGAILCSRAADYQQGK